MFDWLFGLPAWCGALILGGFCFFCTSLGAGSVFFCQNMKSKYIAVLLSFAGGIMLASSFFSLILPALEYCGGVAWKEIVFVVFGFLGGALFIVGTSVAFDKKFSQHIEEKNGKRKSALITASITLHNIPEGMAVGVVLASALMGGDVASMLAAIALAVGIGVQNIPEGASVALALRCQGASRKKAFFVGVASGIVEPLFACVASFLAALTLGVLPIFLAFSAGAMMLVAITELLPEALMENKLLAVVFFSVGFGVMALLDVVL